MSGGAVAVEVTTLWGLSKADAGVASAGVAAAGDSSGCEPRSLLTGRGEAGQSKAVVESTDPGWLYSRGRSG